jgi:hypothetical protein
MVTMKNAAFWDVAPCRYCVNRRSGGTYHLHLQGRKIRERGTSVRGDYVGILMRCNYLGWAPLQVFLTELTNESWYVATGNQLGWLAWDSL